MVQRHTHRAAPVSRVIGRGVHGCAIRPSIACNQKDPTIGRISKVFETKREREDELRRHNSIVRQIDPKHLFTMKLYLGCEIKRTDLSEAELTQCAFNHPDIPRPITRSQVTLYQLVYQDGGLTLQQAAKTIPFEVIFDSLRTAFLGIQVMGEHGVIHTDLKPANIVYNDKTDTLAIIDFGNCTKLDNLNFLSHRENAYRHQFIYWPSEFNAMATQTGGLRNSQWLNLTATDPIIKLLAHTQKLHTIRGKMSEFKQLLEEEPPYMYYFRRIHATQPLPSKLNEIIANYHELMDTTANISWRTVDTYGLGASIIHMLAMSYTADPHMITTTNQTFYVDVVDLCMQMMATDPTNRLQPSVAIQKHKFIVARMKSRRKKHTIGANV